jgi:hypothetical protein
MPPEQLGSQVCALMLGSILKFLLVECACMPLHDSKGFEKNQRAVQMRDEVVRRRTRRKVCLEWWVSAAVWGRANQGFGYWCFRGCLVPNTEAQKKRGVFKSVFAGIQQTAYIKIVHLMTFDKRVYLWNYHHHQDSKHFHYSPGFPQAS